MQRLSDESPPAAKRLSNRVSLAVGLAVLAVLGAALGSGAHLSGPRWTPSVSAPRHAAPTAVPSQAAAPPGGHVGGGRSIEIVLWVGVGLVALVGVVLLVRWLAGRRFVLPWRRGSAVAGPAAPETHPEPEPEVVPEPVAPVVRSGIERALQWLDGEHEPADAVLRAWLGLQESAEDSGIVRRPAETPTEFTTRIVRSVLGDDRAIRTLLRLYLRVRFGEHPVTGQDVAAVRAALAELTRSWPADAPSAAPGEH